MIPLKSTLVHVDTGDPFALQWSNTLHQKLRITSCRAAAETVLSSNVNGILKAAATEVAPFVDSGVEDRGRSVRSVVRVRVSAPTAVASAFRVVEDMVTVESVSNALVSLSPRTGYSPLLLSDDEIRV